jgi:hypothetical protein
MSNSHTVYRARNEATPEAEVSALAAVYRIVLSADQRGRIPDKNDPKDVKGRSESDFHAKRSIPQG